MVCVIKRDRVRITVRTALACMPPSLPQNAHAGAQLEVVRCRVSTDMAGAYRGPAHAASALVRAGGLPALYQGLVPSLAAIAPEAAITYGAAPTQPVASASKQYEAGLK